MGQEELEVLNNTDEQWWIHYGWEFNIHIYVKLHSEITNAHWDWLLSLVLFAFNTFVK